MYSYLLTSSGQHTIKYTLKNPTTIGVIEINGETYMPQKMGATFMNCPITSVKIPDSVTSIGDSAFYNCTNLTSVIIGNGATSIGISAFASCINLASITIPNNVTSIANSAFCLCNRLDVESKTAIETINPDATECGK